MVLGSLFLLICGLLVMGWVLVLFPFVLILALPAVTGGYFLSRMVYRVLLPLHREDPAVGLIRIKENNSPLVDLALSFPYLHFVHSLEEDSHAMYGRRVAGEMLMQAQTSLPKGYFLLLRGCHRGEIAEARLADVQTNSGRATGGAFDVTLCDGFNNEMNLNAGLHRMLSNCLSDAGFVNDSNRWWEWSYGDQYWAARTGVVEAIYGNVVVSA